MVKKRKGGAKATKKDKPRSKTSSGDSAAEILDVAVVGAGVSGLYSAWRLASLESDNKRQRICVFEMDKRVGGRLLSVTPPSIPNAHVELGGMRYTSLHTRVEGLLKHLGIATHPFKVREPQNICYVPWPQAAPPGPQNSGTDSVFAVTG